MLIQAPALDADERAVVVEIDEVRRRLGLRIQQPVVWQGLLRQVTMAHAVRGSNSIEGIHVSLEDAMAAAADQEPFETAPDVWSAIRGYQDALTYVLQLADDPHFQYSVDLIRSLHFMMLKHDLGKWPGRWRPGAIQVVDEARQEVVYVGPDAAAIPALMDELAATLTRGGAEGGLVLGAIAHLNLVMIHPFRDGNGRMARCLQTLVIARTGTLAAPFCSIEEYLGTNTGDYYKVLAQVGQGAWNPAANARPWVRFCLTAHYRQAQSTLERIDNIERLWNALEELVEHQGLPSRTLLALAEAAMDLHVRNARYRAAASISAHQASRDLQSLCAAHLLLAHGEKRGRTYVAAESVQALKQQVWQQRRVTDPFAKLGA